MVAIQAFTEHFPVSTLPRRNRAAPDRLIRAYRHRKPLVLLLGDGRTGPRLVIDAFLDRIEGELDVIRLSAAKTNVIGCTKSIVEALGFETGGLEPSDLGQILTMFLCYQKTHRRRTLICLEDAQDASGWALDELSALVGRELHKRHGLLVVLAGQRTLDDRLRLPAFEILGQNADPRIALSPYDLAETRLYLQRLIEARGLGPIADIIEFDAITRIYEVTNGVPESIEKLLSECLVESRQSPIITGLVDRVAGRLCLASPATGSTDAGCDVRDGGQLFVNVDGRHLAESTIKTEKFRIGRDLTADLRLTGTTVSRLHALIEWTQAGVQLIDLGSTNGTYLDGVRIRSAWLRGDSRIRIGNYELQYRASSPARPAPAQSGIRLSLQEAAR